MFLKAGNIKITLSCASNAFGEAKIYDLNDNAVSTGSQYISGGSSVEVTITIPNDGVKIGLLSENGGDVQFDVEAQETLESLFDTKAIANSANEAAVYVRDNALGVITKIYNTVGIDEFACDLQIGTITFDVSTTSPAYSSIILYDVGNNEIASQSGIYTDSGSPKHYDFNIASICKKIKITRSNVGPYSMVITSNKSLLKDVEKSQDEIDGLQVKVAPLYATKDISSLIIWGYSGFWYNNAYATNAKIDDSGNFLIGQSGSAMMGCLSHLDTSCIKIHIQTMAYLSSGSSFLYGFYSSDTVFDSTTFISGGLKENATSTAIKSADVDVPNGAKTLILCCYDVANNAQVIETLLVTKEIKQDAYFDKTPLVDVNNGTQNVYLTENDFACGGFRMVDVNRVSHIINVVSDDQSSWGIIGPFNPVGNKPVHIRFSISDFSTTGTFYVAIAKGTSGSDGPAVIKTITGNGDYDVTFDATYYRIYGGFTNVFYIWFWSSEGKTTCKIKDFVCYECPDELTLSNIAGNNAKELFQSTDENISAIKTQLDIPSFMISPNGGKFVQVVDNNGNITAKSVIPTKCAFFGNSLMFGNSSTGVGAFGMCATDEQKDFYYLFNSVALGLKPNYVANRYSSVPFETISSVSNIDSVVESTINNLSGDEDLIIIQAGDNTSAAQAESVFPTSTMKLLEAMRTKCPNARIFWPAIWYNDAQKFACIREACKKWGCYVIPIGDLNVEANMGTIGDLIDFGAVGTDTWTLDNVSNVVENSATNITVTFTYNSVEATTTLDVSEYTLTGSTLSYKGRYRIITLQYAHPGDRGMRAIANRLLYYIGLTDDVEYFSLG